MPSPQRRYARQKPIVWSLVALLIGWVVGFVGLLLSNATPGARTPLPRGPWNHKSVTLLEQGYEGIVIRRSENHRQVELWGATMALDKAKRVAGTDVASGYEFRPSPPLSANVLFFGGRTPSYFGTRVTFGKLGWPLPLVYESSFYGLGFAERAAIVLMLVPGHVALALAGFPIGLPLAAFERKVARAVTPAVSDEPYCPSANW